MPKLNIKEAIPQQIVSKNTGRVSHRLKQSRRERDSNHNQHQMVNQQVLSVNKRSEGGRSSLAAKSGNSQANK